MMERNFEPVVVEEKAGGYQALYNARTEAGQARVEMDRALDLVQQARVVGDPTLELHAARVAVKRCNQLTGVLERLASALKKEGELTPVEW